MIDFQRRRRARGSLDLTPLIDVVFQLLVFFLLTSAFLEPGIPLDLPGAHSAQAQSSRTVDVSVTATGAVHVGSDRVEMNALGAALERALEGHPRKRVTVRADAAADFGLFVQVVDACREAGVGEVSLGSTPVRSGTR